MQPLHEERESQTNWLPDWLPGAPATRTTTSMNAPSSTLHPQSSNSALGTYRLSDVSTGASTSGSKIGTVEQAEAAENVPTALPSDELLIERNRDRAVKYAWSLRKMYHDTNSTQGDVLAVSTFS
jgi:hypothetical protein